MTVIHLAPARAGSRAARQASLDTGELQGLLDVELWEYDGSLVSTTSGNRGLLKQLARRSPVQLVHIYGCASEPRLLAGLSVPWVGEPQKPGGRFPWNRVPPPFALLDDYHRFPESVSRDYLRANPGNDGSLMVASVRSPERSSMRERTLARIARFRHDVHWTEFDDMPPAAQFAGAQLWVDAGTDGDGGSLEALASGIPVVACRSRISVARSNDGRSAWLVPPNDPNELAHAVLSCLFRPELNEARVAAARAERDRFDPQRRAAALLSLYRRVTP